jgi:hypothetical protein
MAAVGAGIYLVTRAAEPNGGPLAGKANGVFWKVEPVPGFASSFSGWVSVDGEDWTEVVPFNADQDLVKRRLLERIALGTAIA